VRSIRLSPLRKFGWVSNRFLTIGKLPARFSVTLCTVYRVYRSFSVARYSSGFNQRGKSTLKRVMTMLYLSREEGHAAVEYSLILALMIVTVIIVMALIGPAIGNVSSRLHSL
jgi:pilus assembly protein Flp/PilA